jgi:hypothetical protein
MWNPCLAWEMSPFFFENQIATSVNIFRKNGESGFYYGLGGKPKYFNQYIREVATTF